MCYGQGGGPEDSVLLGMRTACSRYREPLMDWPLILAVPAALAASLGFRAFRSRVRGGRFTTRDAAGVAVIETELGTYTFDREAGKIHLERPGGARSFVKLRDVRGVQVRIPRSTESSGPPPWP